jgi:hypothetical protein
MFQFNLTYTIEIVCVCVCVCLYVHLYLENGYTDLHQTWHAYSLKPGRDFRKVRTSKKCPGFETR